MTQIHEIVGVIRKSLLDISDPFVAPRPYPTTYNGFARDRAHLREAAEKVAEDLGSVAGKVEKATVAAKHDLASRKSQDDAIHAIVAAYESESRLEGLGKRLRSMELENARLRRALEAHGKSTHEASIE